MPLWRDTPENIVGIAACQGSAARAAATPAAMPRRSTSLSIAPPPWFVPEMRPLVGAAQGVPPPQDATSRWWSTSTARSMGLVTLEDISGGDRRRHYRRARRRWCRACGRSRTARSMSTARCRSAISTARWTGTCPTTRRPPSPGSSSTRRARSPSVGQSFTFHGFRFRVLRKSRNRITVVADHAAWRAR